MAEHEAGAVPRVVESGRRVGRSQRSLVFALAAAVAILLALTGLGLDVERGLATWRNGLHPRAASGRVAVVEIDARSLRELDRWPWPRGLYADAIAALDRAGVRTIAFDVDLSSRSDGAADARLARAIAASTAPIALPTFRQASSQGSRATIENLPIARLRARAMLAAVNIQADADGQIRSYPYGITTSGTPRPSIGALLAEAAGTSGESFPIDGAIDPETIPRLSFVDLLRDPRAGRKLAGRSVLIGATAIELGDRYPMPGRGVLPGPIVQILAAETLIQHSIPVDHGALVPVLLMLACIGLALRRRGAARSACFLAGLLVLLLLPLGSEAARLGTFAVVPALAGLVAAWIGAALLAAVAAAREASLFDQDSGLPNLRSLQARLAERGGAVTVLRLANASDLAAVVGHAGLSELVARIASRLGGSTGRTLYRIEDSAIAWIVDGDDADAQGADVDGAAMLLRVPFAVGERTIDVEGGFGTAGGDGDARDAPGRAAAAADRAIAGGLRWCRHSEDLGREQDWRLRIVGEVDAAIAAGDIWVAYQPKLDIAAGLIRAAEALVRWRHPVRGAIAPDAFIPALEESGRIADLTLHVVERALADRAAWAAAGHDLGVAVNVSARLPADAGFVARLEAILAAHPAGVGYLTLEVTESATMVDPDAAAAALDRLAALGVALSIDDYGTGQSTLSYLKRLPAREIKIDKGFIQALDTSRGDQAMVRSTIDLAHELGFKVVAEGVETQGVLDLLRGYGCDVAQGWHIGRPQPAEALLALVGDGSPSIVRAA